MKLKPKIAWMDLTRRRENRSSVEGILWDYRKTVSLLLRGRSREQYRTWEASTTSRSLSRITTGHVQRIRTHIQAHKACSKSPTFPNFHHLAASKAGGYGHRLTLAVPNTHLPSPVNLWKSERPLRHERTTSMPSLSDKPARTVLVPWSPTTSFHR